MTEKIKSIWERYAIEIITICVIAVGFYFTTSAKMNVIDNHETRIQKVEIQVERNAVILERLEKKMDQIDSKIDRIVEKK